MWSLRDDVAKEGRVFLFPILEYRVIDGDTVEVVIDRGFHDTSKKTCRLHGVNTPERYTDEGKQVTEFVKTWMSSAALVRSYKFSGKYGRFIGDFYSETGESLCDTLLRLGYAVAYP